MATLAPQGEQAASHAEKSSAALIINAIEHNKWSVVMNSVNADYLPAEGYLCVSFSRM